MLPMPLSLLLFFDDALFRAWVLLRALVAVVRALVLAVGGA